MVSMMWPPPSSHSKELGQSRWLVFTMYPTFYSSFSYSLDLYCCLSVCSEDCFNPSVLITLLFGVFESPLPIFMGIVGIRLCSPSPPRSTTTRAKTQQTRPTSTSSSDTNMTSESGRNQILAKWQEAFTRLNGGQPGITGLMNFTKVRGIFFR